MKQYINDAFREIRRKYESIASLDIEAFAPVFYPIAIVDTEMEQEVFENFDAIQKYILQLVSLDLRDPALLSETLGLSKIYIEKLLFLLRGYGHVDESGRITQLGLKSLKDGKKITQNLTRQKFQVDALNGTIIRLRHSVLEGSLEDLEKTFGGIGHLSAIPGITTEALEVQLCGGNDDAEGNPYLRGNRIALNQNIRGIRGVQFKEMKYARAYLLKLRQFPDPIIFAKRYDFAAKTNEERFSWQPFCVANISVRNFLRGSDDVKIQTETASKYIHQIYRMMVGWHSAGSENRMQYTVNELRRVYAIHVDSNKLLWKSIRTDEGIIPRPEFQLDSKVCFQYRPPLLSMLVDLARYGESLITTDLLYGMLIAVQLGGDAQISKLSRAALCAVEKHGEWKVAKVLSQQMHAVDPNWQEQMMRVMASLD